ncbi:MAG: DUF1501 domain-containing protein, partial [Verrucomicrobia bacterium]|nr:DUF1501 domain-containing protein [Verrucomicrobiota bacterium]
MIPPLHPSSGFTCRRDFLARAGGGFGLLALAELMTRTGALPRVEASTPSPLAPKAPHFRAKAKRAVFLFMNGGPSQVDTFDPKPALTRYHGQPYTGDAKVGSNGRP